MKRKRRNEFDSWRDELLSAVWEHQNDLWGWTLPELAVEAGLSNSTVYNLHNNITKEPRLSTIYKLAKAVGMSLKMMDEVKRKGRRAA